MGHRGRLSFRSGNVLDCYVRAVCILDLLSRLYAY